MSSESVSCSEKIQAVAIRGDKLDLLESNPCTQISAPGQEHRRDRVLTEDEIRAIWKDLDSEEPRMAAIFRLRLMSAQRGGEVAAMERNEVDLAAGWWTIPGEKSKNGLAHRVPLTAPALKILDHQLPDDTISGGNAQVEEVKKLSQVDAASVVAWGGSGGGSLILEMAGETDLAAVAAWEPATVLFCGLMTKDFRGSEEDKNTKSIMAGPGKYFTAQHRQLTREKLSKIRCPVIVTHGDVSALKKINFEFFFPELMNAGKKVTISIHPGMPHGLSWYSAEGRIEKLQRTFEEDEAFFRRFLLTQPSQWTAPRSSGCPIRRGTAWYADLVQVFLVFLRVFESQWYLLTLSELELDRQLNHPQRKY